jgi:drug/metabolite transporter (DMT)-like permease
MLLSANLLGIIFALTSALVWGGADFGGGFATRRNNQFHVLALSALSGIAVLIVCAVLWRETFLSPRSVTWAALAGASGAIGVTILYRGLSMGNMASVAPTSAVIGAALPVGFGLMTQGLPTPAQMAGFGLAFVGIWLASRSIKTAETPSRRGFLLGCLAGVCFGGFFILIAQVEAGKVFTPLIVTRGVSFSVALLLLRLYRLPFPSLTASPLAYLTGALDAAGNVFYLLARQFTRLDIAVVLSCLYPVITVLLASILLKEKVSPSQWAGVAACLAATVLITL